MNAAVRPAGWCPAYTPRDGEHVGALGADDEACPECGRDVFGCDCPPPADTYTADDVAAAIADWKRRADTAVRANEGYRGMVDALKAEVRRAHGAGPSAPVTIGPDGDVHVRGGSAPTPAVAAVAAAPAAVAGRVWPGNLGAYLARLEDPPRIEYACQLAAAILDGTGEPPAVDAAWFAKIDAKVRRLVSVHVGR